jgi:hypothetical protein
MAFLYYYVKRRDVFPRVGALMISLPPCFWYSLHKITLFFASMLRLALSNQLLLPLKANDFCI